MDLALNTNTPKIKSKSKFRRWSNYADVLSPVIDTPSPAFGGPAIHPSDLNKDGWSERYDYCTTVILEAVSECNHVIYLSYVVCHIVLSTSLILCIGLASQQKMRRNLYSYEYCIHFVGCLAQTM